MAILIDEKKRVLVQGITGREGRARTRLMREYGSHEEFATKDSELLACDIECRLAGTEGFYLELHIPGLDQLIGQRMASSN